MMDGFVGLLIEEKRRKTFCFFHNMYLSSDNSIFMNVTHCYVSAKAINKSRLGESNWERIKEIFNNHD